MSVVQVSLRHRFGIPGVLFIVAVCAYGLLIPKLGFYWDDLPITWIRFHLGPEAFAKAFSTNRPIWGLLHQFTTSLIPPVPVYWQIFALLLRWLTAVLVYKLFKNLFPSLAFHISILFLLYPGFNGHWASYVFSHLYIVMAFFILSLVLMLEGKRKWTILALFCSALNLWMTEYFFVIELIRPAVLWIFLKDGSPDHYQRIRRMFSIWIPYLVVFIAAIFSRLFIHSNQAYTFVLLEESSSRSFDSILNISRTMLLGIWTTCVEAWGQILQFSSLETEDRVVAAVYFAVLVTCSLLAFSYYSHESKPGKQPVPLEIIFLGVVMLPLAGMPFWLANIPIGLAFPASRTTLPFMLSSSLILVGLLQYVPVRVRLFLFSVLIGLAAGKQLLWSGTFQREWELQKDLFWQLAWRAPSLEPNTTILLNDRALYFYEKDGKVDLVNKGVLRYYADNSLAALLNWMYDPGQASTRVSFVLFYPKSRIGGSLPEIEANVPIVFKYPSGIFRGNTSQVVAFFYAPPGCLRLLDPEIDPENQLIPRETLLREAAYLSSSQWIESEPRVELPDIYGPEPDHGWCFYFEKADLARQHGNWSQVVDLANAAFSLGEGPGAPVELFLFIEGYAHTGDWRRALELSKEEFTRSPNFAGPLLCKLWSRIAANTGESKEKELVLLEIKTKFGCPQVR